jgi:cellulose synthase/poly-beta-1,6-N-acetylglucosamine synthase-like glycosyltransferase
MRREALMVAEPGRAEPAAADREPPGVGLVSVIVPHLNDYDNLDACLTLIGAQTFPGDRTEVIVADNGSSRGLDAVCEIVGSRGRVIEVAERGAGPARNAGVRASSGGARRSPSSTAIVGRTSAGSRKASPNSQWRISPAGESTCWLRIRGG